MHLAPDHQLKCTEAIEGSMAFNYVVAHRFTMLPMTDIFLVLAGFLMGLSFLGGFYLFCIPVGVVALVFGWLNRPKGIGSSTMSLPKPITERIEKFVRPQPVGTKFVSENEPQEYNEPSSALSRRKVWEEVENDVDDCLYEALQLVKKLMFV